MRLGRGGERNGGGESGDKSVTGGGVEIRRFFDGDEAVAEFHWRNR